MKQQNLLINSLKFVAMNLVGNLLYWPAWWYSAGFIKTAKSIINSIKEYEYRLGLKIWLANLFKPMYGQADWQGRLISFFMRILVLIFRLFSLIIWSALMFALLALWLIFPPIAIYKIITILFF